MSRLSAGIGALVFLIALLVAVGALASAPPILVWICIGGLGAALALDFWPAPR